MQKILASLAAGLLWLVLLGAGPASASDPLTVCVGAAGAMRLIDEEGQCKPEEKKTLFAEWEAEEPEPPEDDETAELETQVSQLSKRLAALENEQKLADEPATGTNVALLERRVSALETKDAQTNPPRGVPAKNAKTPARVVAPFEVVAPDGTVILRVAEIVGNVTDTARVTIGAGPSGKENYGVRVNESSGGIVAGIGQGSTGKGMVYAMETPGGKIGTVMYGETGQIRSLRDGLLKAGIGYSEQGGMVGVFENNEAVATLSRSSGGDGGNITVRLNNGFGVFSAGAAQDGGGEACVNRVTGGGDQRRSCLGIELPSMGLGK